MGRAKTMGLYAISHLDARLPEYSSPEWLSKLTKTNKHNSFHTSHQSAYNIFDTVRGTY
jgi:hypothetical protein